jgi:hypothetical protein
MVSGPPQQGAGTSESPSGWLIAVERWEPTSPAAPAADVAGAGERPAAAKGAAAEAGEAAEASDSGEAGSAGSSDGQVVRQLVWGGCAGLVLRGAVSIQPLIAQALPAHAAIT